MSQQFIGIRVERKDIEDLLMRLKYLRLISTFSISRLRKDERKRFKLLIPMNSVYKALKDNKQFGTMIDYIESESSKRILRAIN